MSKAHKFCRAICGLADDVAELRKRGIILTAAELHDRALQMLGKKEMSGQPLTAQERATSVGMKYEYAWLRYGRPHFNVCTPLLDVLEKTPLDIPFGDFKMPFPAFSICFEVGQTDVHAFHGGYVREYLFYRYTGNVADTIFKSMEDFRRRKRDVEDRLNGPAAAKYPDMCAIMREKLKETERALMTPYIGIYGTETVGPTWVGDDGYHTGNAQCFASELHLEKGQTLQAALDAAFTELAIQSRALSGANEAHINIIPRLIRIAAGVAMIGTSDPMLVRHDWPEGWEHRRGLSRRHRERVDKQLEALGRRNGYVVGEEQRLPFHVEHVDAGRDREEAERHLEYGHWRRAYWGWRRKREGNQVAWRLRPVKMTRVRADLPLKPSRGYEIAAEGKAL